MEPRGNGEIRRPPAIFRFKQTTAAISSLNEAWFHTLDEYVIDTPLNEVLLPLLRNCFLAEQFTRFCCCEKVMANRSLPDIAGFITEEPES
jgi:hypothetical protein